jgi:hypothetical protein
MFTSFSSKKQDLSSKHIRELTDVSLDELDHSRNLGHMVILHTEDRALVFESHLDSGPDSLTDEPV